MAGESIGVEVPIVESFNQVNTWLTNNSDSFDSVRRECDFRYSDPIYR